MKRENLKIKNKPVGAQCYATQKGITLIALIVTIIILLILAGVSLTFIIGENGIIKYAEVAGKKYQNAAEEERNQIAKVEDYIENSREELSTAKVKKDVLFEGTADTVGTEYELNGSVKDYSVLLIYACLGVDVNVASYALDTELIDVEQDNNGKYIIGGSNGASYMYTIKFKFTSNNKLRIGSKTVTSGWAPYPYYIYRIVGIK